MEAIKTIALVDDDLKPVRLIDLDEKTKNALNDDTSDEFEYALEFAKQHLLTPHDLDVDNISEVNEFFNGDKFVADVLTHHKFSKNAPPELAESLSIALESSKLVRNESVFDVIRKAFPDTQFEITEFFKRPDEVSILAEYDLVIMDLMMDDEYRTPEQVSKYLGSIAELAYSQETFPAFILMSSRTELDEHRTELRMKAQVSTLGFSVINKSEIDTDLGSERLKLIWLQMNENKDAAKQLRTFYHNCENSLKDSWQDTMQSLWNIDAAFLQRIHHNTEKENYPFADHLLDLIGKHHLRGVESDKSTQNSLLNLDKLFKKEHSNNNAFQTYSKESPIAIHDLTSANYFSGLATLNTIPIDAATCDDKTIVEMLPFGAILSKSNNFPSEEEVLIHCTQQCDLSRNVFSHNMSLVFMSAQVVKSDDTVFDGLHMALPLLAKDNETRWYAHVNLKKIISNPADVEIKKLSDEGWKIVERLRGDVVRQLRQELFQTLSRIEKNVSVKNSSLKIKILLRIRATGKKIDSFYFSSNGENVNITLTKFDDTYHLIDPVCLDVALWVKNKCDEMEVKSTPSTEVIEQFLRSHLPKISATKPNCPTKKIKFSEDEDSGITVFFASDMEALKDNIGLSTAELVLQLV